MTSLATAKNKKKGEEKQNQSAHRKRTEVDLVNMERSRSGIFGGLFKWSTQVSGNSKCATSKPKTLFRNSPFHPPFPSSPMDVTKDHMITLLDHGLYSSAQLLVRIPFLTFHPTFWLGFWSFQLLAEMWFFFLIDLQGQFLVSSQSVNAETNVNVKAENLVGF